MAKQVMPKAELAPRASDVPMTDDQFGKIGLFAQLKRKPTLDKFPGAMVLRRFRKGEVVCRQGESGWTAFYILSSEDLVAIGEAQDPKLPDVSVSLGPEEMGELIQRLAKMKQAPVDEQDLRTVAIVSLAVARQAERKGGTLLGRLGRKLLGGAKRVKPKFIPIDGPRDLDYQTLESRLYEGDMFGEASCLYRTPRSATIVATRDCYMLEVLRNILDQLQKDPVYKAKSDEVYKQRVLQLQLRQLPIFSELTEQELDQVRNAAELITLETGQILFDEHEPSDCMYIIRSGLLKVVQKVSALLAKEQIRKWPDFIVAVRESAAQPASARGKIWQLLPETVRTALAGTGDLSEATRHELLQALNVIIKNRALTDGKEFQDLLTSSLLAQASDTPDKKRKDWAELEIRRLNRLVLDSVLGKSIRPHRRRVGPECVLSYLTKGEFVGEMGAIVGQLRGATCIAFGHPQEDAPGKDSGQVELVRIRLEVFRKLMETSRGLRAQVERAVADRNKLNRRMTTGSAWETDSPRSKEFQQLGLIQGQRLMLIDLDRCTRCDECVTACANTHDDGRSRLFLDGPRIDHYLVPVTCRSCLDPVCMIGCPVGSIHRGNNLEIEIEDWCIGCGLCAKNCPYGSIIMHDLGIIPNGARGWRFMPAAVIADAKWYLPRFADDDWLLADAPMAYDRRMLHQVTAIREAKQKTGAISRDRAICFRFEFQLDSRQVANDGQFRLEMTCADPAAAVWMNGQEIRADSAPKRGKSEYSLPQKPAPAPAPAKPAAGSPAKEKEAVAPPPAPSNVPQSHFLRKGRNVIAVKVMPPPPGSSDVLLDLRLDSIHRPPGAADSKEEVTEKLVTEQAVVCDLCSSLWGQVPSCVSACPHDAAMRVDARFEFPGAR